MIRIILELAKFIKCPMGGSCIKKWYPEEQGYYCAKCSRPM